MNRFIRYLYEYEQGQRSRNVGFVKVEQNDSESVIHIHGKGLHLKELENLKLSLLRRTKEEVLAIPQGEVAYMGSAINERFCYTKDDSEMSENGGEIDGLLLESSAGRKFVAMWEERPVNVEEIHPWQEPVRRRSEREASEMCEEGTSEDEEMEEEPVCPWKVTKIKRQEISMLPRCEWRLANHPFLLHGYYNYRHLVLLDDGKILKLGVPGIYHEKEAEAARRLGFPEFIRADRTRLSLSPEEKNEKEDFGYWCRQVRR